MEEILNALTQNTIEYEWPQQVKDEWIRQMKKDSAFYKHQSRNAQQFQDYEEILLDLSSKYLKRKITLIPFLEGDQAQSFFPNDFNGRNSEVSKISSYHLLCC